MKRILAILCVIACLCGLCVPAMAAGTITVSVKAPADWAEVCLYVWNDDGEMTTWPGDAMVKSADGLWTLAIPAGLYTNVIANNGSDAAKTADLKMDGTADCWIDAGAGVVYTDAGFSNPFGGNAGNGGNADGTVNLSGLNSLALVGTGIPGVSEWTPGDPAGDMTKNSNGIYTKVIAVTAGTTMQFKIAGNDAWDDAYNFGGSEAGINVALGTKVNLTNGGGSADLTLTAAKDGNLKFTVDLNEMTVLVEETDEEASVTPPAQGGEETGETYTVYAKVPEDWKSPAVWCWDANSQNPSSQGAWPGSFYMTKGDNGWWSIEIPAGYTNILINANGGGNQTPDITGLSGADVWVNAYTDSANPVFAYEEIVDIEEPAETVPPTAPTRVTVPPTEASGNQGEKKDGGKDQTVLWAVVGSVVIIAIAAVIVIIFKGKKKA